MLKTIKNAIALKIFKDLKKIVFLRLRIFLRTFLSETLVIEEAYFVELPFNVWPRCLVKFFDIFPALEEASSKESFAFLNSPIALPWERFSDISFQNYFSSPLLRSNLLIYFRIVEPFFFIEGITCC